MSEPITTDQAAEIADFLDSHTMLHRWLVAFFRHFARFPREAGPFWSFWTLLDREKRRTAVIAHSFHSATTFLVAVPDFAVDEVEALLEGDLMPERLVGDSTPMASWEARSTFLSRARSREDLVVLGLRPGELRGAAPAEGFRAATQADVTVLREFERGYALERGEEDPETDIASQVAAGMVFVLEVEDRVAATVRSNLSDGRFVHVGGVYVHPAFRGRGLGPRVLAGLCERIHAAGDAVVLDVDRTNEPALRTYRAVGFSEAGSGAAFRFSEDTWRTPG